MRTRREGWAGIVGKGWVGMGAHGAHPLYLSSGAECKRTVGVPVLRFAAVACIFRSVIPKIGVVFGSVVPEHGV
jgi:hypothetical protein